MQRLRYGTSALLSLAAILAAVACGGGSSSLPTSTPSDVAFGEVVIGTSASRLVKITNTSDAPMTILDVTATSAGVTASGPALPATLAAGASTDLAVRFAPETPGDVRGTLYVRSDLTAELITVTTYTGKGILPSSQLTTAPSAVDFGTVTVGASASRTVTLANGGSKSVNVSIVTSSSTAVTTSGLALPVSLAAGASRTFQVVFRPTAAGATAGNVAFRSDPSRPLAVVEFHGDATSPVPALSASPGQLDFQDVPVGEFSAKAVTLTNDSAEAVTISAVTATGAGVSASGLVLPAVVAPGASTTLSVRFTPTAIGAVSGSVSVLAPGRAEPLAVISCAGRGVAASAITSVTVRDASVDASGTVQLVADVLATGTIDTSVTWSVESGSLGTVDAVSGVYGAPSTPGTYRVRATSVADPSKQGVGAVTVVAAAPPPPPPPPPPSGALVAFPGAQGAGAASVGGRGGAVYEVTTLADSGTGSLRACVQASGPRTCVFRVAGDITLASPLIIKNPYVTIAGQTAPGGGITVDGRNLTQGMVGVYAHDAVIRYVRFRKGYNAGTPYGTGTVFGVYYGVSNTIVDHCSISWGQDDALSTWTASGTPSRNLTFSWNMVYEGYQVHSTATITGAASQALADGMTDIDYHHNLFASFSHRSPLYKNKSGRVVNNLVYNANNWSVRVGGGARLDVIGNVWKNGPLQMNFQEITVFPGGNSTTSSGSPTLYVAGNVGPHNSSPSADNWTTSIGSSMVWEVTAESGSNVGPLASSYRRVAPLAAVGAPIAAEPATSVEASVLPDAGASRRLDCSGRWVSMRDSADAKLVADYRNGTGGIPADSATSVAWPTLAGGTPCADADHDGMPDAWETAHGLNPGSAADRNGTTVLPPYTNLEAYLAGS